MSVCMFDQSRKNDCQRDNLWQWQWQMYKLFKANTEKKMKKGLKFWNNEILSQTSKKEY